MGIVFAVLIELISGLGFWLRRSAVYVDPEAEKLREQKKVEQTVIAVDVAHRQVEIAKEYTTDPYGLDRFFDNRIIVDPDGHVKALDLLDEYKSWAKYNEVAFLLDNKNNFGREVIKRKEVLDRRRLKVSETTKLDPRRLTAYFGIRLNEETGNVSMLSAAE